MDQKANSRANNNFKVKQFGKSLMQQSNTKRLKRLGDAEAPLALTKSSHAKIDLSRSSQDQIRKKTKKLKSGTLKNDEKLEIIQDLYAPSKTHFITKEIREVLVTKLNNETYSLDMSFNIYHNMEHQCCVTQNAVDFISSLDECDMKYFLTHNMKAKVLRQRVQYRFLMTDPNQIVTKRKVVNDYTKAYTMLYKVDHIKWSKSHEMTSQQD